MPRPAVNMMRRAMTLDTGQRAVDLPVDGGGHLWRGATWREGRPLAVRANEDGPATLDGHAIVFGQRTWIGPRSWGFWEVIEAGSTKKTTAEKRSLNSDIVANREHDNAFTFARTSNGSLQLEEDAVGQLVAAPFPLGIGHAQDTRAMVEQRFLTGMSFAFDPITYEWSVAEDGSDLLTHREIEQYDVALVASPAYPQTDAKLRGTVLGAARHIGMSDDELDRIGDRIASDPAAMPTLLRSLLADQTLPPPAETTGTEEEEGPPAETTGAPTNPLRVRHLAARMRLMEMT